MDLETALREMRLLRSAKDRIRREYRRLDRANVDAIDPHEIAATVYERMKHELPLEELEEMSSDYCRRVWERPPR